MREISIEVEHVKRATISWLREAAQLEGLFWEAEKIWREIHEEDVLSIKDPKEINDDFALLESRFVCAIEDESVIIKLSKETSRETLLIIKNLLETFSEWSSPVWLDIGGKRIDTKKKISTPFLS